MNTWPAVGVALGFLLGSMAPLAAQDDPEIHPGLGDGETHVRGFVADRSTGDPLPGVSMILRATGGIQSGMLLTMEDGTFHFASIPSGGYRLELRRLGYQGVDLNVEADDGSHVDVRVEMVPAAVELDPVVVTSSRRDRLALVGFYERRRSASGRFLTRAEIQSQRVLRVSHLFRSIAGFTIISGRGTQEDVVMGRGNCHPALYVDGILVRTLAGGQIDQALHPDHLEGLEVYSGSQTPGQFLAGRCGTIVAWTHAPTEVDGHPFEWKRLGMAAGLVLLVFTVMF